MKKKEINYPQAKNIKIFMIWACFKALSFKPLIIVTRQTVALIVA